MTDDIDGARNIFSESQPYDGLLSSNAAVPDGSTSRPVLIDCDPNVDLDAADHSENFSIHSSTSGVSSLIPRNSVSKFTSRAHLNARPNALKSCASASNRQSPSESWAIPRAPASDSFIDDRPRKRQRVCTISSQHSSSSEHMGYSSFYQARTAYGGASSCHRLPQRRRAMLESTVPLRFELEPQNNQETCSSLRENTNLSSTARRILENLERFSTPLSVVDRVPLPFHAPSASVRNTPINNSIKSHRFPPYMHAYSRLKSIPSYTPANEDKVIRVSVPVRQSNSFKATDSVSGGPPNRPLIEESGKNKTTFNETVSSISLSHLPLFVGSTTEKSLSNASNSIQKDAIETPVTSVAFTFAPPLRRLPSASSRLAALCVPSTSLKYTFSLPNRLDRTAHDGSVSRSSSVIQTSPIFAMIKDPHRTHVVTSTIPDRQTSISSSVFHSKDNWRCEMCLLENSVIHSHCSGCSMPKSKPVQTFIPSSMPVTSVPMSVSANSIKSIEKGRWECPTCMVYNDGIQESCVCCDTKKPFTDPSMTVPAVQIQENATLNSVPAVNTTVSSGSQSVSSPRFAVGSDIISIPHSSNKNAVSSSPFTTLKPLPVFGTPSTTIKCGKWVCPTCMVNNNDSDHCCPCCATKNPQVITSIEPSNSSDTSSVTPNSVPLFKFPVTDKQQNVSSPFPFSFGFPVSCNVPLTTSIVSSAVSASLFSFPITSSSASLSSSTATTQCSSHPLTTAHSPSLILSSEAKSESNVSNTVSLSSFPTVTSAPFSFGSLTSTVKSPFSFGETRSKSYHGLVNGDSNPLSIASIPSGFSFQTPLTSITNTSTMKPSLPFTFGFQPTVSTVNSASNETPSGAFDPSASNIVQSSAPFLFGSTNASALPSGEATGSKLFRLGAIDGPSFGATTSNVNLQPSGILSHSSTANIFSATSTTLAPRKKIHAARRLR